MFWQKVSSKLGTRTAEECQFQHQGQIVVLSKKDQSVRKVFAKEKKDPGQKGTLHILLIAVITSRSRYTKRVK